ncbi:MAG: lysylphosphatidylglycerol synthase domain-containing protein [Alphaproteobacteria bacterium]
MVQAANWPGRIRRAAAAAAAWAFAAVAPALAGAGPDFLDGPLMWRLDPPFGGEPSYIVGTMHVADARLDPALERAIARLGETGALIVEAVPDQTFSARYQMATYMVDGRDLAEMLGPDRFARLVEVAAPLGIPDILLRKIEPWRLMFELLYSDEQLARIAEGEPVFDQSLIQSAQSDDLMVVGLETADDQIAALRAIPPELALQILIGQIEDRGLVARTLDQATEIYVADNLGQVAAFTADGMGEYWGDMDQARSCARWSNSAICTWRNGSSGTWSSAPIWWPSARCICRARPASSACWCSRAGRCARRPEPARAAKARHPCAARHASLRRAPAADSLAPSDGVGDGMGRWIALAGKIVVTGLLAWLAVRTVDFEAVGARWALLDPLWLVPAAALIAIQLGVAAWRWYRIGLGLGAATPLVRCSWITLVSMFFNQTLPSVIGGDAIRVWLTRDVAGGIRMAVHTVLVDRGAGLLGLLLLGTLCLPGSLALVDDDAGRLTLILIVSGGIAGAVVFFLLGLAPSAGVRLPGFLVEIRRFVAGATRVLLRLRPGVAVWSAALTVHLLTVAILLCLARGIAVPLSAPQALYLVPPVLMITVLPITVAGWGLREGAMIAALDYVDVPADDAFALSVLFGVAYLILGAIGGLTWLAARGERERARSAPAVAPSPVDAGRG